MNDSTTDRSEEAAAAADAASLFMAPAEVPHYEQGPVTVRSIELKGILWAVTYYAELDDIGWRVRRCECHPVEAPGHSYKPGEMVPVMLKILEDEGPRVRFLAEGPGETHSFWGWRSQIAPPRP
jgi:hypothetical protein